MILKKGICLVVLSSMLLVPTIASAETEGSNIEIQSEGIKPAQEKLDSFISKARNLSEEYSPSNKQQTNNLNSIPETFNYTFVEGDTGYFYERSSVSADEYVLTYPIEYLAQNEITSDQSEVTAAASDTIPSGIGGRATVQKNGSINTFVIRTPATTTGPTARTYIYGGFSGVGKDKSGTTNRTIESDMGLVFSSAYGVNKWQPTINYYWGSKGDGNTVPGNRISPYNEIWYKNGYVPGKDVDVTIYRNLGNNTRLSTRGYALYADHEGNGTNTYLTAVTEIANTYVSSTSSWKYLATIADTVVNEVPQGDAAGQVTGILSNILIDGSAYTPVSNGTDFANVTVSSNNVTIKVSK
ncbi:YrpD family protein [Paenibacillus sp. FSL L8-0470]|uniref:YrpD family protein n=1 Tax=Paenibacillus sp. FSL L8-0470 TaxID=2954688 RepID=UPI0030FA1422